MLSIKLDERGRPWIIYRGHERTSERSMWRVSDLKQDAAEAIYITALERVDLLLLGDKARVERGYAWHAQRVGNQAAVTGKA